MAAPIDQLNFKVILNDTDFKARINEDIALAGKLNTSLSKVIQIKTRQIVSSTGVNNAKQMSQYLTDIANKIRTMPKGQFLVGDADRLNATLAETNKRLDQIIAKSQKAGQGMGATGSNLQRVWLRFTATLWSVIGAIRIFTRTVGSAIKNISNFEQANANLATIMQVSRKEIETLTNDALMLGRTTEWTASQVTELQTALAKLGFNIPQIRNMQASVLQFATAVGAKLPDAANLAGASLRMFGMHSTEMQKALEILAASTNKTALDFEKLKVSLPYVGAIAHSIGFDIAQTASLLGVLTNAGLESSRAGTGLRQVLLELSKTNGKLQTAMGGNVRSFDDFVNALQAMRDRGLEAGEATKLVSTRASSALLILANGVDTIRKLNDEVRDTDGLLKDIQSERLDTLHGSTLLLKSAWEGLIQTFRESAGPMKDIVDWLTKIVRATSLAASRANRVAQGTKDVIGSDELTKQFKEQYEGIFNNLVNGGNGMSPDEAAKAAAEVVQDAMQKWLNNAMSANTNPGIEETGWYRFFTKSIPLAKWITKGVTRRDRAADEQVEAMENAQDAVTDYMANRAKEEAEIAAYAYLEQWKAIFNAKGEKAAREAMANVASSELIDEMKNQMNAYIANGGEAGAQDRGKGKTKKEEQQELIDGLKREATYLRKLYDDYKKLEQYLDDDDIAKKMVEIFGEGDYAKENIEQGILDITDALKGMGSEGKEAAEEILRSWGLDKFSRALKQLQKDKKAAEDAQKVLQQYEKAIGNFQKELDKWEKEWGGKYFGFNAVVEKEFVKYKNEDKKIDDEYIEALNKAYEAYNDDTEALKEFTDQLYEYYLVRKKANEENARKSVSGFVDDYVKEATSSMSLKDWGDKSIKQVYDIWKSLKALRDEEIVDGLQIGDDELFADLTFEKFSELTAEAKEELKKKLGSLIKEITGDFKDAAQSVREFAEATGNLNLVSAIDDMMSLGDAIATVASRALGGDWIGAITAGLSFLVKSLFDARIESAKLEASLSAMREESRGEQFSSMLSSGVDSIFGTNDLQKVENAVAVIDKARKSMAKYASMEFNTTKKGFWSRIFSSEKFNKSSIEDMAKAVGGDLYDAYGNLNAETLQTILDTYDKLDTEQREWIEHAINDSEAYADAMKQVEDVAESIIGSVVSNVADKLVDSWWEAGEAALDYADILGDVAKAYAKLVVQDLLLQAAFDEDRQKAFVDALKNGDASTAMAVVEQAMQSASDMLPIVNDALQAFEPYRNMASETLDSNSVGSGFKSITEDTANLLASYFNAARADVSVMRGLQETGWKNVAAIAETVASPTLNDYLAQIAATNFDIAQSSQSILSELQSVIGSPGTSGMVVRVEYA